MEDTNQMAGIGRQPSQESSPQDRTRLMANLWARMTSIYGHAWTSSYDEHDVTGTWTTALASCTPNDIARGLQACIDKPTRFPPNLAEFREMCKPPGSAQPEITRALPEPESVVTNRANTAKHWHKMWVLSGLKPADILSREERQALRDEFGPPPYVAWGNEKIQTYCEAATKAIKAGRDLPKLEEWV